MSFLLIVSVGGNLIKCHFSNSSVIKMVSYQSNVNPKKCTPKLLLQGLFIMEGPTIPSRRQVLLKMKYYTLSISN